MRRATGLAMFAVLAALGACTDLRDYRGTWAGGNATLAVDQIDTQGLQGSITLPGGTAVPLRTSSQIEADVLSTLTHAGSPLHVYLAYFDPGDGCGEALAVVSLYESRRLELRVLRGAGTAAGCGELYGTYPLTESP